MKKRRSLFRWVRGNVGGGSEGGFDNLFQGIHEDHFQIPIDFLGQVVEIGPILFGQDHGFDTGPTGGQELFLDAAHGQQSS